MVNLCLVLPVRIKTKVNSISVLRSEVLSYNILDMFQTYMITILECPINYVPFLCQNYSTCISATKLCNGVDDCGDFTDENSEMCKHQ